MGNTELDKNSIVDANYDYTAIGGDNTLTMQALANWGGLAEESKAPFVSSPVILSNDIAYSNDVILHNAEIISNMSEVKAAIYEHGAVMADMYYSSRYMDYNTGAYYDFNGNQYNNHVVTIVGWDDTYDKNNFNSKSSTQLRIPKSDGAWIVQNSYGENWGDSGYFYISYEDMSLENAMVLDVQDADIYDYNYQYDGNANPAYLVLSAGDKAANVFEVKQPWQRLEAVGFTT